MKHTTEPQGAECWPKLPPDPNPSDAHSINGHRYERSERLRELERENTELRALIAKAQAAVDAYWGAGNELEAMQNLRSALAAVGAGQEQAKPSYEQMQPYLERQWEWSKRTFGAGRRTNGILQHIRKELAEIEAKPEDLIEWLDVVILAMDGYWRHGGKPDSFMADLLTKQRKNFARTWPTPTSEDEAVEHDRTHDSALAAPTPEPCKRCFGERIIVTDHGNDTHPCPDCKGGAE